MNWLTYKCRSLVVTVLSLRRLCLIFKYHLRLQAWLLDAQSKRVLVKSWLVPMMNHASRPLVLAIRHGNVHEGKPTYPSTVFLPPLLVSCFVNHDTRCANHEITKVTFVTETAAHRCTLPCSAFRPKRQGPTGINILSYNESYSFGSKVLPIC